MVNFHPRQTSPGLLQWFREVMDKQGVHVQVFIDPETDLELGVFLPTATIKQRIEKALRQEQPVSRQVSQQQQQGPLLPQLLLPPPPPLGLAQRGNKPRGQSEPPRLCQAYGSDLDETSFWRLEKEIPSRPELPAVASQDLIFRTTNKDRKKLQRQAEKGAAKSNAVVGGRVAKGKEKRQARAQPLFVARAVDSTASEEETANPQPPAVVDPRFAEWIFFQRMMEHEVDISIPLETKMKNYALAIAGPKAVQDWHDWRAKRLLTSQPTSRNGSEPQPQPQPQLVQQLRGVFLHFYHAYDRVKTIDTAMNFDPIIYRHRMVQLFQLYNAAESFRLTPEPVQRIGRKRILFRLLYPGFEGVGDLATNPASKLDWDDFTRRLSAATRWQRISRELGYGALVLIPESIVTRGWIERGTTDAQFAIWLRAILRFNREGHMACLRLSKELDRMVRAGCHNAPVRTS
jgi:hypothetical protein